MKRIIRRLGFAFALLCMGIPAYGASAPMQTYHVRFAATVAGQPFACGLAYNDLGLGHSTARIDTFRFYVSQVALIDADGNAVPLSLDQDGTWQRNNVAFINFDDNAQCSSGTKEKHDEVVGTAPSGHYVGLRFTLGVPEEFNHADATIAESPLNVSEMFWSWQDGYKFLRVDARVGGGSHPAGGYAFHLGSTGCNKVDKAVNCMLPNRPQITLEHFDPASSVVAADIAGLLRTTDLEHAPNGGCMSDSIAGCAPVMRAVGLVPGKTQALFSVK